MSTALSGLSAAESTISAVSNNLANARTPGYKQSRPAFATQTSQTLSAGAAPSSNSGGSNPVQVGRGVRVVGNVTDFSQGSIIANPSGLVAASGAEYTAGPNSGLAQTGSPDQGGYGSLYPGAVEMSNTDIGGNQIDLMLASNQFRANLQVVRTADDLLGELMNLRRPS